MSELNTQNLDSKRPFEERVFARFDALELRQTDARLGNIDPRLAADDSRLENIDTRLNNVAARLETVDSRIGNVDSRRQKLEIRAYDPKPIWEQALKEIVIPGKRSLTLGGSYLSVWIGSRLPLTKRADLRDAEDRIDKIERKPVQ